MVQLYGDKVSFTILGSKLQNIRGRYGTGASRASGLIGVRTVQGRDSCIAVSPAPKSSEAAPVTSANVAMA